MLVLKLTDPQVALIQQVITTYSAVMQYAIADELEQAAPNTNFLSRARSERCEAEKIISLLREERRREAKNNQTSSAVNRRNGSRGL